VFEYFATFCENLILKSIIRKYPFYVDKKKYGKSQEEKTTEIFCFSKFYSRKQKINFCCLHCQYIFHFGVLKILQHF